MKYFPTSPNTFGNLLHNLLQTITLTDCLIDHQKNDILNNPSEAAVTFISLELIAICWARAISMMCRLGMENQVMS